MPRHHLSASKMDLAMRCAWWARPDAPPVHPTTSRAAIVGTAIHSRIHETIEGIVSLPTDAPLTPAEHDRVTRIHRAWLPWWEDEIEAGRTWSAERVLALDPVTLKAERYAVIAGHRDYSAVPENMIPMTADALRVDHVIDWKSGDASPAPNGQLKTIAATWAILQGAEGMRVSNGFVDESGVRLDTADLDTLDLADWLDRLCELMQRLPTAEPVPGAHCRELYCPQFGACPATSAALEVVAPTLPAKRHLPIVTLSTDFEGAEHAAYQYQALRAAKARIELAWEACRRFADANGGIPVGDGKTWIKRESSKESLDLEVPGAFEALQGALGDQWRRAVSFDTSKAAIERAARVLAKSEGTTISAIKDRTVDALRAVKAVKVSPSVSYDEVTLKGGG